MKEGEGRKEETHTNDISLLYVCSYVLLSNFVVNLVS